MGQWTFREQVELIQGVQKAVDVQILNPKIKIKYHEKEDSSKLFKLSEGKLTVYRNSELSFEQVKDQICAIKASGKPFGQRLAQISWQAISEQMKTKSSDDIRYFWNHSILPLLVPSQTAWTLEEDLALLQFVSDEDLRGQDYNLSIA